MAITPIPAAVAFAQTQLLYRGQTEFARNELLRRLLEVQILAQLKANYPADSYGFELR